MNPRTPCPALSRALICHPSRPAAGIDAVTVGLTPASTGQMEFRFRIAAPVGILQVPPPGTDVEVPVDGLWQHTCCEVFLARMGQPAYREFNFSPSGHWAAYAFSATRQRDVSAEGDLRRRPEIQVNHGPDGFDMRVTLLPQHFPSGDQALCVGLSAVLEAASDASCSYWALRHPTAVPDFHHRGAFALCIAP